MDELWEGGVNRQGSRRQLPERLRFSREKSAALGGPRDPCRRIGAPPAVSPSQRPGPSVSREGVPASRDRVSARVSKPGRVALEPTPPSDEGTFEYVDRAAGSKPPIARVPSHSKFRALPRRLSPAEQRSTVVGAAMSRTPGSFIVASVDALALTQRYRRSTGWSFSPALVSLARYALSTY